MKEVFRRYCLETFIREREYFRIYDHEEIFPKYVLAVRNKFMNTIMLHGVFCFCSVILPELFLKIEEVCYMMPM